MSEKSEKGEKKVVRRSVAIALGIACIVLAMALAGTIASYASTTSEKESTIASLRSQIENLRSRVKELESTVNLKDSTIASLRSQITEKDDTISSLNSQIAGLRSRVKELESTVNELRSRVSDLEVENTNLRVLVNKLWSIIDLKESTVWVDRETVSQPAGWYTYWTFNAPYAGYVVVQVHSSTTENTYVRVMWSSHGAYYDHSITVGASGTAVFPVLPGSIEIRVGNTNLFGGATETVTIIYFY